MNILIRTDAINIGTGHVIRCLALADELRQRGANVSFICRIETGNLIQYIYDKCYKVYPLPADIDFNVDCELTQNILKIENEPWHWLIIDHYGIDISWELKLRDLVNKIMVIDDLSNRQHDCDALLDQNYSDDVNRYNDLVPNNCIQLLGPSYALLRPQFLDVRKRIDGSSKEVKKILVFMGGVDPDNATGKALRAVKMLDIPNLAVDVVIGPSNPFRNEIEKLASSMKNTTCHFEVDNMANLMAAADIGIGAVGSTTWERSCLGLPTIVMVLSENQSSVAQHLDKIGAVINLGPNEKVSENGIRTAVERLINDPDKRRNMSLKGQSISDGRGVERVASVICR